MLAKWLAKWLAKVAKVQETQNKMKTLDLPDKAFDIVCLR